jgi:hypothetical protein
MLALTLDQQTALEKRHVMRRLFIWCNALDPDTLAAAPVGFWDDVGVVQVTVDGGARTYYGSGTVVQVGSLSAVGDMTIPGLSITISGIPIETAVLVRGSTVAQRPIELHVGIFDVATRALIGELVPRFKGVVDDVEIRTPAASGVSDIVLTCESVSRALTIQRYDTRSLESAKLRDAGDLFYKYTSLQREKAIYFGRKGPRQ